MQEPGEHQAEGEDNGRDESRREQLIRLYEGDSQSMLSFFIRLGFHRERARELVNETFARAFRGLDGFRDEADVRAWLFGIAKKLWLKNWKEERRDRLAVREASSPEGEDERRGPLADLRDEKQGPHELAAANERDRLLRGAIAELPELQRQCLVLRTYQDRSYAEIASLLGLTVDEVKSHLHQGRTKLINRFEGLERGQPP